MAKGGLGCFDGHMEGERAREEKKEAKEKGEIKMTFYLLGKS